MSGAKNHWRWITRADLTAVIEEQADGWHVCLGNCDCGVVANEQAAVELVDRIASAQRQGGPDAR